MAIKKKKKNEILPFATAWMGLEGIMLSEISQTEKDKYLYVASREQSKQTSKTETDSDAENRLMVARGEGGWRTR